MHHRHRMRYAVRQDVGNGGLKARRDISRRLSGQRARRQPCHGLRDRRFQSGKAEVAAFAPQHRPRERVSARVAIGGQAFQRRPSRPAQTEQLADLVERLAGRVIDGGAKAAIPADAFDRDTLAVSAGNQQQQLGKRQAAVDESGQTRGQRVRFEVVHGDIGQPASDRDSLGELAPDDQSADQTRPGAGGDGAKGFDADAGSLPPPDARGLEGGRDGSARRSPAPRRRRVRARSAETRRPPRGCGRPSPAPRRLFRRTRTRSRGWAQEAPRIARR